MAIGYVLYNKNAGRNGSADDIQVLREMLSDPLEFIDVTTITDYGAFLSGLNPEDYLVLAGGDGTLNCFANNTDGIDYPNEVLYYPNGTGNDFAHDLGYEKGCQPFPVRQYLQDLPQVTVNGKTYRFINGIGYGIDGFCCEVGDELKKIPGKKINYTMIAIKGLLYQYKPTDATITVDGKLYNYKKVWLAPTMFGRFYGGGVMPTPAQTREDKSKLSTMVYYGRGRLTSLLAFPSMFKGEHVKYKKMVDILSGQEITVSFDRPTALQIDGETILGVSSYTATAAAKVNAKS